MQNVVTLREFDTGYLAGLVDGEGYLFVHHDKAGNRTYPDMRIYCKSKSIIEGACRILDVNPHPRRDHGKLVGWLATVQGEKALLVIRRVARHLTDSSKRCRAFTILKVFDRGAGITGKHPSSQVFAQCPDPVRLRAKWAQSAHGTIERRVGAERPYNNQNPCDLQGLEVTPSRTPLEMSELQRGWLCGLVDGEGHIHVRYRSDRRTTYPRLRIFAKSWQIVESAARLMGVRPYARRSHGELLG